MEKDAHSSSMIMLSYVKTCIIQNNKSKISLLNTQKNVISALNLIYIGSCEGKSCCIDAKYPWCERIGECAALVDCCKPTEFACDKSNSCVPDI